MSQKSTRSRNEQLSSGLVFYVLSAGIPDPGFRLHIPLSIPFFVQTSIHKRVPPPFSPLSGGFVKRVTGIVSDYPRTLQKREGSNATITSLVADIDAATDHVHLASALPIGNPMLRLLKGRIDLRNHPKIVVVAVANQNSGVGKMALSFNLAQIHAGRKGTNVLTIDNDPQGKLASSCIILNVWQK